MTTTNLPYDSFVSAFVANGYVYSFDVQSNASRAEIAQDGSLGDWQNVGWKDGHPSCFEYPPALVDGRLHYACSNIAQSATFEDEGATLRWSAPIELPWTVVGGVVSRGNMVYAMTSCLSSEFYAWTPGTSGSLAPSEGLPVGVVKTQEAMVGSQLLIWKNYLYALDFPAGCRGFGLHYLSIASDYSFERAWMDTTPVSDGTGEIFNFVLAQDYLYAVGQESVVSGQLHEDGVVSTWRNVPSLPHVLLEPIVVATDTHVYVLGGAGIGQGRVTTVYYARFQ